MVMPWMPSSVRASFTSASLNGLIIASIFFMAVSWQGTRVQSPDRLRTQCDTSPAAASYGATETGAGRVGGDGQKSGVDLRTRGHVRAWGGCVCAVNAGGIGA